MLCYGSELIRGGGWVFDGSLALIVFIETSLDDVFFSRGEHFDDEFRLYGENNTHPSNKSIGGSQTEFSLGITVRRYFLKKR
jgi:hypothetical protein